MVLHHTHPWTHSCIQQSPLKRDAGKHLLFTAWQKRALNVTYFCFSLIHKWRAMEENKPFPSLPCRSWRKAQQTSAQTGQELQLTSFLRPKEEGKDKNRTVDAVLHFCPDAWIKHALCLEARAMVRMLFIYREPQKLLLYPVTFIPCPWTSFSSQGLHLEILQYGIFYTEGWNNVKHSQKYS